MKAKRFISALLALVMVLAMAAPALAEGEETYTVTAAFIHEEGCDHISLDPTENVAPGTTVNVGAYPKEGWRLKSVTKTADVEGVVVEDCPNLKYGFFMPEANVTVTFEFEEIEPEPEQYTIELDFDENIIEAFLGQPWASEEDDTVGIATVDDEVWFKYGIIAGYRITSVMVEPKDEGSTAEPFAATYDGISNYSFVMPAYDVIVRILTEPIEPELYTIVLDFDEDIVEAFCAEPWCVDEGYAAAAGDQVQFRYAVKNGYQIAQVIVEPQGGELEPFDATPYGDTEYTFVMPADDVIVRILTEPVPAPTLWGFKVVTAPSQQETVNATYAVSPDPEEVGETDPDQFYYYADTPITITATAPDGYVLEKVKRFDFTIDPDWNSSADITDGVVLNDDGTYTVAINMPDNYITVAFWWKEAPAPETYAYYVGSTASFNDNIKLNFYVKYQEAGQDAPMPDNVYAVLTCVDKTVKIRVASVTPNNNGYRLPIDLVAKQVEDDVTLKLVVGEDGEEAFPFRSQDGVEDYTETGKKDSLLDYFTRAIDSGTTSDTMKALARAARDYCYAAAQEFGYNWHDQYTFSAAVENVTAATLADYEEVEDGNYPTGVSHKGYSVMFEADNSFRKYLKFTDVENPEEAFTYKVDGTVAPLLKQATRGYYLTFKKVYSNKLQKPHTIEISDGTNTYTLSASVLTYCRLVLLSDKTSDAMKTLAKAAYLYNQAAIAQFGE